jgi:hypothetical protein
VGPQHWRTFLDFLQLPLWAAASSDISKIITVAGIETAASINIAKMSFFI